MIRRLLLVLLVAVLAAGTWFGPEAFLLLRIGTGYVAKQLCSCTFVAGRDPDTCRADMIPSMDSVRAEILPDGVRAWVPLLGERVARHRDGRGCTLDPRN